MNNRSRTTLFAITAIATVFTLGKSVVNPEIISSPVKSYSFPQSIALSLWQLSTSKSVNPHLVKLPAYISGNFIAGKHYRYLQNEKQLDIEMRYLTNTNGDLKSFITSQTGELSSGLKERKSGFYSLYTHEGKAYLSACINPHGKTTVTSDQFNHNLMVYDTRFQNIFPWLLGQAEFWDKRCLWAHLSTPLDRDVATDETYKTLETAWFNWYSYWRSHFE